MKTPQSIEDELSKEKIEALAEMICRAGDEPAAALLVLMGMLGNSSHPKELANPIFTEWLTLSKCELTNVVRVALRGHPFFDVRYF